MPVRRTVVGMHRAPPLRVVALASRLLRILRASACCLVVACGSARVEAPRPTQAPAAIVPLSPIVVSMPSSAETSIESVGDYLRERAPTPRERLKAVHDWVADRIAYDGPAATGPTPPADADPRGVFAGRKAVCEGYARLLAALGRAADLDVEYVLGVARLGDGTLALHAWNEAHIDGELVPIDVTWDSGNVDDARLFHKVYTTRYLFAARAAFEADHVSLAQVAASLRAGCDARTVDLCLQIAQIYDAGRLVPRDPELAASVYRATCDAGCPEGCFDLAWMYEDGGVLGTDLAHALSLFGAACDAGFLGGCNDAGAMYALGRGVPRDFARARSLFRAACDGGEKTGCANLDLVSMVDGARRPGLAR